MSSPERSVSPSRSPTRRNRCSTYNRDSLLANLSPNATLTALSDSDGLAHDHVTAPSPALVAGIAQATSAERAFGVRAALAWKNVKGWQAELLSWDWPLEAAHPGSSSCELGFRTPLGSMHDGVEYWGSLPSSLAIDYEVRIGEIRAEMEDLGVDILKQQILTSHSSSRPGTALSGDGIQRKDNLPSNRPLDDFTAIITATVLRTLPHLSQVEFLLDTWTVRIAVLRVVPIFLTALRDASRALSSGWKAIEPKAGTSPKQAGDAVAPDARTSDLDRLGLATVRSVLEDKISLCARHLDSMLDALEGRQDTLPNDWLEAMDAVEADYTDWVVKAESVVRHNELLQAGRTNRTNQRWSRPESHRDDDDEAVARLPDATSSGAAPPPTGKDDDFAGTTMDAPTAEAIAQLHAMPPFTSAVVTADLEDALQPDINAARPPQPNMHHSESAQLRDDAPLSRDDVAADTSAPRDIYAGIPIPTPSIAEPVQGALATPEIGSVPVEQMPSVKRHNDLRLRAAGGESDETQRTILDYPAIDSSNPTSDKSPLSDSSPEVASAAAAVVYKPVMVTSRPSSSVGIPMPPDGESRRLGSSRSMAVSDGHPQSQLWAINDAHRGQTSAERPTREPDPDRAPQGSFEDSDEDEDDGDGKPVKNRASIASVEIMQRSTVKSINVRRSNSRSSAGSSSTATFQEHPDPRPPIRSVATDLLSKHAVVSPPSTAIATAASTSTGNSLQTPLQMGGSDVPSAREDGRRESPAMSSLPPLSPLRRNRVTQDDIPSPMTPLEADDAKSFHSALHVSKRREAHLNPQPSSKEMQLEQQISSILARIPANIRLTSAEDLEPATPPRPSTPSVPQRRSAPPPAHVPASSATPSAPSSSSSPSSGNSPAYTLAPAKSAISPRAKDRSSNSEVQLYHLRRAGGNAPIKLFVRLVGERGERVMVRVGGGWADLGEYLRDYAVHHGHRSVSEGRSLEIRDIPVGGSGTNTNSASNSATSTPLGARASNGSARNTPGSAGSRPPSALASRHASESGLLVPKLRSSSFTTAATTTSTAPRTPTDSRGSPRLEPRSALGSASPTPRSPSGNPWADETASPASATPPQSQPLPPPPPLVGLGGLKGRGRSEAQPLSAEKQKWVDGLMGQVREQKGGSDRDATGAGSGSISSNAAGVGSGGAGAGAGAGHSNGKVGFGELGSAGGIRRIFRKGSMM
ncbi:MAG: hypothetical protein M1825_004143 [Sarcosagium campestre]|nr:MAG: hypothetical protein M1825_004143 [Sarcosagium campestre]